MISFLFTQGSSFFCPIVVGETENRQPSQFLFQAGGPLIPVSGAVPRSSRPYRDERVLGQGLSGVTIGQVPNSSWYRELCPVHRGLIAMSGSSGKVPAE